MQRRRGPPPALDRARRQFAFRAPRLRPGVRAAGPAPPYLPSPCCSGVLFLHVRRAQDLPAGDVCG